jgi:hypothetical protein
MLTKCVLNEPAIPRAFLDSGSSIQKHLRRQENVGSGPSSLSGGNGG